MHPIEYVMLATGIIVTLLAVAALWALVKAH